MMHTRHLRQVSVGVCLSAFLFVSLIRPASAATGVLLGVYFGNQGWKMNQVRDMETWQGKKHAVVNLFTNWCNRSKDMDSLFNQQLMNIWSNRNVPLITWEPHLCSSTQTPADVEVRAARGDYDGYVSAWADRLRIFLSGPDRVYNTTDDRRAYLRLGHEMNGDWYGWSAAVGNNSPTDFIAMWQRVRSTFDRKGLDAAHLQWMWSVNHTDTGPFTAEQYFPGDAWVDWVAIDGYNWGRSQSWSDWKSPTEVYDNMLDRLRVISTKPVAVTEYGSSSATAGGPNVALKSQWITDVHAYVLANDVRMVAWFNEDKETDWAVFGGSNGDGSYKVGSVTYKTYAAYKVSVGNASFVASDPSNPRLLTDYQFAGQ